MDDDKLIRLLLNSKLKDDDEAMRMIFSNYIDIGGSLIGLTVENAIKAGKLLREYDKRKSQNVVQHFKAMRSR